MTRRTFHTVTAMNFTTYSRAAALSRGSVAFCYAADFDRAALDWYSRFDTVVTGGFLRDSVTRKLAQHGCRLLAYEWASGFYPGDSVSADLDWQKEVLRHQADWLLDRHPTGGGAASPGKLALWYDFGDPELCRRRAEFLMNKMVRQGYEGLFLDTLGFEQLPAPMRAAFTTRRPHADYNRGQSEFLRCLRKLMGRGRRLFLNQGYRQPDLFLPYADLDLTESYFTADGGHNTLFRPWHSASHPWESIHTPMRQLVRPAMLSYPHVQFVHLGYAAGPVEEVRRAIHYNFAAARLWNHHAYLMMPLFHWEQDEIYFQYPGRPLTETFSFDDSAQIAWREFEKGVVAINSGKSGVSILNGKYQLLDPPRGYYFSR